MAAFVDIRLDTQAPPLGVSVSENSGGLGTIALTSSPDAFEVKVWGDIDVTQPLNSHYGETEGGADWIPFDDHLSIRLVGAKRVHVRVRDDVWNQSAVVSDQVEGGVTPPPPPPQFEPVGGLPDAPREKRPEHRTITSRTKLLLTSASAVTATGRTATLIEVISNSRAHKGRVFSPTRLQTKVETRVVSSVRSVEKMAVGSFTRVERSRDPVWDDEEAAVLLELGVL